MNILVECLNKLNSEIIFPLKYILTFQVSYDVIPKNNHHFQKHHFNVSAPFSNIVVVQIVVQMKKAATKKCLKTCL